MHHVSAYHTTEYKFTAEYLTELTVELMFPGSPDNSYDLRKNRPHDRTLVSKTSLTECDYIMRMIFKDVY